MSELPLQTILPFKKIGPLFNSKNFKDTKDPCLLFDGDTWHIYGSGGSVTTEDWQILHATALHIEGPWTEHGAIELQGIGGPHIAAPSVTYDEHDKTFHMTIQEDFMAIGGGIHYLASKDGQTFSYISKIIEPLPESGEDGLYDPHFSIINGEKYLVYAAMSANIPHGRPFIPQPDIYLAKSQTGLWAGPWERLGKILDHEDISWHHNHYSHPDYEWGIEGPQLVELPNGKIMLNATCFLSFGDRGTRQRVFFAISQSVTGPYKSVGPVLDIAFAEHIDSEVASKNTWESGENGHATAHVKDDSLYLFYQARPKPGSVTQDNQNWKYGIAVFNIADLT